jgi:hypothetical protein
MKANMASPDTAIGFLSGIADSVHATVSRSRCASASLVLRCFARVDFPEPELPNINNFRNARTPLWANRYYAEIRLVRRLLPETKPLKNEEGEKEMKTRNAARSW